MAITSDDIVEISTECRNHMCNRLMALDPEAPRHECFQVTLSIVFSQAMQLIEKAVKPEAYDAIVDELCIQFRTEMDRLKLAKEQES